MTDYVLLGLTKRRAELSSQIEKTRDDLRKILADLENLDATIMQFNPDFKVESIRPKAFRPPTDWSNRGQMSRVVLAPLRTTKAGEERLGLVRAGAVLAVADRVVDPAHLVVGMKAIPSASLVSVDNRARSDMLAHERSAIGFFGDYRNQRTAATLTGHNDGLPFGWHLEAPVLTISLGVFLPNMAACIHAINFDHAE